MVKVVSGGGIGGNKVVQSRAGGKVEPKAKAISPAGVSQFPVSTQFTKEKLEAGRGYTPAKEGSTGIANARQGHSGVGPGGGDRTIFKSGSQCPTPQAPGMPPGRGFGDKDGR